MKPPTYVIASNAVAAYSPANHTGTSNQRLISRETVGARYLEVLIGTIQKGHGALRHSHPDLEQASYLLHGEGISEVDGIERAVVPGAWKLHNKGSPHRFTVTSDTPVKIIVVYAPPYAENPKATVVHDDPVSLSGTSPQGPPHRGKPMDAQPFTPEHHTDVSFLAEVDASTMGAEHLAIYDATFKPGAAVLAHRAHGMEQVIFVRKGALHGCIEGVAFAATAGDWVFFPEGVERAYVAAPVDGAETFVIHAFSGSKKEQTS